MAPYFLQRHTEIERLAALLEANPEHSFAPIIDDTDGEEARRVGDLLYAVYPLPESSVMVSLSLSLSLGRQQQQEEEEEDTVPRKDNSQTDLQFLGPRGGHQCGPSRCPRH